jgi:hypothetical protein
MSEMRERHFDRAVLLLSASVKLVNAVIEKVQGRLTSIETRWMEASRHDSRHARAEALCDGRHEICAGAARFGLR